MLMSLIVGVTTTVCRRSSRGAALSLSLLLLLGSRSIVRDRLDNNGFSTGDESLREPQRDISRRKFVRHTQDGQLCKAAVLRTTGNRKN